MSTTNKQSKGKVAVIRQKMIALIARVVTTITAVGHEGAHQAVKCSQKWPLKRPQS